MDGARWMYVCVCARPCVCSVSGYPLRARGSRCIITSFLLVMNIDASRRVRASGLMAVVVTI